MQLHFHTPPVECVKVWAEWMCNTGFSFCSLVFYSAVFLPRMSNNHFLYRRLQKKSDNKSFGECFHVYCLCQVKPSVLVCVCVSVIERERGCMYSRCLIPDEVYSALLLMALVVNRKKPTTTATGDNSRKGSSKINRNKLSPGNLLMHRGLRS